MAVMTRRVHGLETEYGLQLRVMTSQGRWRRLGADEAAQHLFEAVVRANASSNVYLRNGGRLYLDVGSHPEYATAECASIADLVAHDRAGDLVLDRLAGSCLDELAGQGTSARVSLFKNNVDSHGNSWGSHENYQVARGDDEAMDSLARQLSGFLVTRQLVCGAGHWQRDRLGQGRFLLSQRAAHMTEALGTATTRSRPLVNTRDEPHADPARHRRLHVIVGDSTLIETCTALRVGSTELVLRAIEAGLDFTDLEPVDTGEAIRTASLDVTGRAPLPLRNGSSRGALEVQRTCWERTRDLCPDDELRRVHELWGRVLDAVGDGAVERIADVVDWAAKLQLLRAETERHGLAGDDPRLAQLDLAWHDIRAGQGLFGLLEARGRVARWNPPESAGRAMAEPPATRALLRSRLVEAAQRHRRAHTVDWMRFTCHDLDDGALELTDPLAATDERVDELCLRMGREPRRSTSSSFAPVGLG